MKYLNRYNKPKAIALGFLYAIKFIKKVKNSVNTLRCSAFFIK